jgi:4,5-dihydroxyphthalate decarboxylase
MKLRLGVRNWDHLTPLHIGDVAPQSFDLELSRVELTPDLDQRTDLDGAEASASHALLGHAQGDRSTIVLPIFVLSAFRHRSFIVRRESDLTDLAELAGKRVGLTAWADTGNTLSRAVLREAGVENDEVQWRIGPMTADAPFSDASFRYAPSYVEPSGRPLRDLLGEGELDAVVVSFMPREGYGTAGLVRRLLHDYREREVAYYEHRALVPGLHVLKLRTEVAERNPEAVAELLSVFAQSYDSWMSRRVSLADTTPWLTAEFDAVADTIGLDWSPYSLASAFATTTMLGRELYDQGIVDTVVRPDDVFGPYLQITGQTVDA